ncbi:MAG: UvrD-helicase domain-containing protein [Acidimicrobiia bacterium]
MTAPTRYDPAIPLGQGRTIIEASAGTGKTFTIAAAVTRLVAEEGLTLEEILVVTFTRAATAELKSRIRRRMVGSLRSLQGDAVGEYADEHLAVLLEASAERRELYCARIDAALTRFDRAQIFTIHGFAQRLLAHLGFRSRLSAGMEPGEVGHLLLRRAAADLIVARFAGGSGRAPLSVKDAAAIGAAVVETPDARVLPDVATAEGLPRVRAEMAADMRDMLHRRMRADGVVSFDDGLVEARDALTDARIGESAREVLSRRYAVALVDESQDTDPIQWQVIRAVFDESRLVVIGDPKQAIYGFRGADVESYLAAVDGADARRTLETNWRSDGPLVTALDALFAGATFGDPRIAYHTVEPAEHHVAGRIHGAGAPLQIRRFSPAFPIPRYKNRPFFLIDAARRAVAADVATEIARLLGSGVTLVEDDDERPIGAGDIAVLCRTRIQVDLVRRALGLAGVPSVAARSGGVLTTAPAESWRRFLHAVERPDRLDRVRMGATTSLVGMSLAEVAHLSEGRALELQSSFQRWRALLHDRGLPALLTDLDRRTRLAARVLAEPDGERTMTDLAHIAEELHAAWRRGRVGSLVVWLEAAMAEAAANAEANVEDPESRQRRLQTDAAAVQVQTIHGAKGLEYPVVLAPFLWDAPRVKPQIPIFHDPAPVAAGRPRPRLIQVGGSDSPNFDAHRAAAMAEDVAEEGRLLYVALTRARHHLVVWWVENTRDSETTKLHELLTRGDAGDEAIDWLIEAGRGTIAQTVLTEPAAPVHHERDPAAPTPLDRARLGRSLDHLWRRVSFSSLSPDRPLTGDADTAERPDRVDEAAADEELPAASAGELPMAELPRGARFGSLVHEIFERLSFDAPDLEGAIREELIRATRHARWVFDTDAFVTGMVAAIETPLGPGAGSPALRELDPAGSLKEMDFEFPVRTTAGPTSLSHVGAIMLDHLPEDDPHRAYAFRLRDLANPRFHGFLTGAIDLTAVVPDQEAGRYVVMDFKSNALPALGSAPSAADYGPRPLAAAMHDGNYVLQALLYQVALHRYLQWRLTDYEPGAHLGGSRYLFIRGMIGHETPVIAGERCGVARWLPPAEMIVALSDLFAGRAP